MVSTYVYMYIAVNIIKSARLSDIFTQTDRLVSCNNSVYIQGKVIATLTISTVGDIKT